MLLVKSAGPASLPRWQSEFARLQPGLEVRWWDDPGVDPAAVRYTIVWQPEPGRLARFPNLEIIFSSAAGVDHIVADPDLPKGIPIVRMATDQLAQTIGEYVCLWALAILRDQPRMAAGHRARAWDYFEPPRTAGETRVSILGLGVMGTRVAAMLAGLGFAVSGWSRTAKSVPGVATFHGAGGLDGMLAATDIAVLLLPETQETRGLLDARRLALMPAGAAVINTGRGGLIVGADLLAALDSGRIGAAVLDVFEVEPLPADDPLWRHPRVHVTAHIAGYSSLPTKAARVSAMLDRHRRGEPLTQLYDAVRGY